MQIHKIKQYSIISLIRILSYKLIYKLICLYDKFSLKSRGCRQKRAQIASPDGGGYSAEYQRIVSSCSNFFNFVATDDGVISEAEQVMNGKIRVFDTFFSFDYNIDWLKDPISGNFWPNVFWSKACFVKEGYADVKYVLEINKLNHLVTLAQAYYITYDEKYIANIKNQLKAWTQCVPAEMSVANKITMDLGFRTINLVMISLLCAESEMFRTVVHPQILEILDQHKRQIWRYLSSRWFKSGNDNNHNIGEIIGLYVSQIWLRQFGHKCSNRIINRELSYLKSELDKLIAPSGAYKEMSSNYTRVVHDFLLIFELIRHSLDYNRNFGDFEKNNYFERLSEYLMAISYAGKLPNFGDNDYAQVALPFIRKEDIIWHVKLHHKEQTYDNDYSDASQWVYKSEDNNNVFLFTRAGKFAHFVEGAFVHAHNDILSLIVGVKGYELFIDKGCLFYNSGMEIRKNYSSITAHNSIMVDDIEMTDYLPVGYSHYPYSAILESKRTTESCYFTGLLEYKGIRHERTIQYCDSQIEVTDHLFVPTSSHTARLSYLLAGGLIAEETGDNTITVSSASGGWLCDIKIEGANKIEIADTDYAPHYALTSKTKQIKGCSTFENEMIYKTTIIL